MTKPRDALPSLHSALNTTAPEARSLRGLPHAVTMAELAAGTLFDGGAAQFLGRNVMIATSDQFTAGLAMAELDGVAARMLVCPPALEAAHRDAVASEAGVDIVVHDDVAETAEGMARIRASLPLRPAPPRPPAIETEWLLLTSGTTGVPKIVSHSLAALTGAIVGAPPPAKPPVWATFYDIRRYGGLQIFLRALLGTGSMVLPGRDEQLSAFLERLGREGVTHISGTPSHWRRVLMNPSAKCMTPDYVRLSGEIADQPVLDALAAFYPQARVGHAYASTEAGVGFEVTDGLAGFPAAFVREERNGVAMKVVDDTLRIRSTRTASRYVGRGGALADADGFVDTGDIVQLDGNRYYFAGRRGGIINIGGLKVHPEEIEAVLNRHPAVRMSLARSRKNPITGAVVTADIVLTAANAQADAESLRRDIHAFCRDHLEAHKVPATIRFVPSLDVTTAGKLARHA
jgi:acyl-coenzyme A synthetase/AMP-(fatty) acid ligase